MKNAVVEKLISLETLNAFSLKVYHALPEWSAIIFTQTCWHAFFNADTGDLSFYDTTVTFPSAHYFIFAYNERARRYKINYVVNLYQAALDREHGVELLVGSKEAYYFAGFTAQLTEDEIDLLFDKYRGLFKGNAISIYRGKMRGIGELKNDGRI